MDEGEEVTVGEVRVHRLQMKSGGRTDEYPLLATELFEHSHCALYMNSGSPGCYCSHYLFIAMTNFKYF